MKSFHTLLFFILVTVTVFSQAPAKPNFIFIVVDDLNDYTESLGGQPQITTPNINALEERGTSFTNGFCNATGCAPSRTSFLSGKDLHYTKVYFNSDYKSKFRDNFTVAKGNKEVFTLPEILKDSGGYYTYAINKVFHQPNENDFDKTHGDPCDKGKSWNKMLWMDDSPGFADTLWQYNFGDFIWGKVPDSLETKLQDYRAADTAIQFINDYAAGVANTCGRPFFLALGCHLPHSARYVPAKYFPPYYVDDILHEPFTIPYNNPPGTFPYNGYVMPPQPAVQYGDYFALPEGSLAQQFADASENYEGVSEYVSSLPYFPEIDPSLTDDERRYILEETVRANTAITYTAAVQFIDAQIGRVMDALEGHPDLLANTIIILVSDNGYSLGEKRHWGKWTLWEPTNRIPFIIVDPNLPPSAISARTASLVDVFPTVMELSGTTKYPHFSDGSNYLDGVSLVPILTNANTHFERPVLESFKKLTGGGSCFPQYAVRSERFHFIRYQTNNDGSTGAGVCSPLLSQQEDELYDFGLNRDVDPEEWNNLAYDPDYAVVKEYLQQWFPDSAKYLQKTYTARIQQPTACYYKSSDIVNLKALLYDPEGIALTEVPAGKHLEWWTNLGGSTVTSIANDLVLSSFPELVSGTKTQIIIYLALYNDDHTIMDGFDMLTITVNNSTTKYPKYKVKTSKKKVVITGIVYPPETFAAEWSYGDGFVYNGLTPPIHSYAAMGTYTISCKATIGGADGCTAEKKIIVTCDTGKHVYMRLAPNPVQLELTVSFDGEPGEYKLEIYNTGGIKVAEKTVISDSGIEDVTFDMEDLTAGVYIVRISGGEYNDVLSFIKAE